MAAEIFDTTIISRTAFRRFRELMADMDWCDETAIENLNLEIGYPLGLGRNAVKVWFDRESIPTGQIFNIANVFGVDAGWLAGTSHLSKEKATDPHGFYGRDIRSGSEPS